MQGSNTRPEVAVQTIHCLGGIEKSAHFKFVFVFEESADWEQNEKL
jgi:hypothetical protein